MEVDSDFSTTFHINKRKVFVVKREDSAPRRYHAIVEWILEQDMKAFSSSFSREAKDVLGLRQNVAL